MSPNAQAAGCGDPVELGGEKSVCYWVGTTGTGIAAFERTPLVLGQSTPDSGVLAGLNSPAQTVLSDLTATADGLGFLCLDERGAGVPDGEEQLGVLVQAGSTVTPRH